MSDNIGVVDALETHISQLFFTPDRVFKLLKPVETSFVSFADREERLEAATREYRLNRRISPDVYLGLADIVEVGTAEGELTDRLIVMRRLPADRQLDRLVDDPQFDHHITEAARLIAAFHSRQEPVTGSDAWMATAHSLRANWSDNFAVLEPLAGTIIPVDRFEAVQRLVDDYLRGREILFEERIAAGRVCDGHGDLRAEHVFCLDEGPRVIDCLAFRDDFRIADVLLDVAFLAMDLHHLAGPGASTAFIRAYDEFTDEHHPSTLAHHYVAYRAHVRAKVAAIRYGQGDQGAVADVERYHRLTLEHLEVGEVRLVLVGGGAGAGKSTVAEGVAGRLGAIWLRSDEVRKALAGVEADQHVAEAPGEGIYDDEFSDRVYRELLHQAETLLRRGESAVLDATWGSEERRGWARELAARTGTALTELNCVLPLAVAQERIARRMASIDNPSDATPEIARFIADRFEDWPTAHAVDTELSIPASIEAACRFVVEDRDRETSDADRARRSVTVDSRVLLTHESIRFYLSPSSALLWRTEETEPSDEQR